MTERREWHYSHNVSDSFWRCYGCGAEAGDEKLYERCPTPDEVGKSCIIWHECPCKRTGQGCINYTVNETWPYYVCAFTNKAAYVLERN